MTTLPLHAHRTFAADERSVAKARAFAREMLEAWDAGDLADSVVLLVSELVTNAVVHAGTTARLELRLDTQSVRVEVEDLHPRRVLPMVVDQPTEEAEDGRGLLITFSLASAWGVDYTSGSKRVWLRFDRPVDQQAPRWSPPPGDAHGRAHVAVAELSGDGVVTAWNDDAVALLGWRVDEVRGRHFDELLDRVPGDHDTNVPSLADMTRGWQGTYPVLHKSDQPVTVFASHVGRVRGRGSTVLMVATDQRALIERPAARPGAPAPDSGFLGLMDEALVRLRLDDYLMLAVERVRDRLSADAAYLLMLRDLEDEYELKAVSGLSATLLGKRLASGAAGAPDHRNPHLPVVVPDFSKTDVPLLSGSGLCSLVLVPITAENRVVGAIGVASAHVEGFTTDESVHLQQIANALAVATDRARLQALERERRGWLTFLAEAGDFLAGSLDQDMTMAITGQIVVPKIAQWCAVHLDDDRGHPVLEQVWHEDERQVEPLRAFLEEQAASLPQEPDEPDQPGPPSIWGEVLTVPLIARGRRIGHLSLGRPAGDPLRGEPLLVAESVARRAAMAIENARAHGQLRAIGNALQRSLLPSSTPKAPGLDVGVVYEAAGEASTAGGDFYDLFPIGGGKSCFVVGDVCGTGPEAAAVTGLARHTIRALVLAGFPISDVLERLNTAIIDEGERSRFLTLVCGVLRPDGDAMRVEMVSAGHPLPIIVRGDGAVEQVGRPQSLLGVVNDVRYFEEQHRLSRGELFVAVTDGVLERRFGSMMLGEEGLTAELDAVGTSLSAQAVAERIRRLVVEFAPEAPRDDMAVLVLRLGEAPVIT